MEYSIINNAILTGHDVPKFISRDNKFYSYLLNNNVAYYYSKQLSRKKNEMDKKIIAAGEILNNKFLRTLKLINKVCKALNIKFLLFKTYKYIPEAVDGDIDLFIKKKDFYNFLKSLEKIGFSYFENEKLKAICIKEGYCNVEPRVNASFHEQVLLNEEMIWKKIESVDINGMTVFKVTKEIDLFYLLISILYRPDYLRLYLLFLYRNIDIKKLFTLSLDKQINYDLKLVTKNLITENIENKHFPLFMGNIDFVSWWFKRILPNSNMSLFIKLKHILFFFYSKYAYLFLGKLIFQHNWPL